MGADRDTAVGKMLGTKLLVGIGLISYSAYLWHQPMFALVRQRTDSELDHPTAIVLVLLSLALAYFTWRFVEIPFRSKRLFVRREIFGLSLAGSLAVLVVGASGYLTDGFSSRYPEQIARMETAEMGIVDGCDAKDTIEPCVLGNANMRPSIAILGDSHAEALSSQLSNDLAAAGASALLYYGSFCAPLIDVGTSRPDRNPRCRKFMTDTIERIAQDPSISAVVLIAEWTYYTTGRRWENPDLTLYADLRTTKTSVAENAAVVERGLGRTLAALKSAHKKIVVVETVPEYEARVGKFLVKNYRMTGFLDMGDKTVDSRRYAERNSGIAAIFTSLQVDPDVEVVDTFRIFCPDGRCRAFEGDRSFYSDSNHLSKAGSAVLAPRIVSALHLRAR